MSARVLVIGGTSESRAASRALREAGFEVRVSALTNYGAQLAASDASDLLQGALDASGMASAAGGCVAIVDATHPFAREASEQAREGARLADVAYVRFERAPAELDIEAARAADADDAARVAGELAGEGGTVLLTVGSRTLPSYVGVLHAAGVRCVARVLPVPEALAACAAAGLGPADIIAMQGPTSASLDEALLRHLGATVLVTKESGAAAGVDAKLEAARRAGASAVVVARPVEPDAQAVHTPAELVDRVRALAEAAPSR